jgi:hypothetical protein
MIRLCASWPAARAVISRISLRSFASPKIRAAKKRLEARKAAEAKAEDERKAREAEREGREPPKERPELRKHAKGKPRPSDQENFTGEPDAGAPHDMRLP